MARPTQHDTAACTADCELWGDPGVQTTPASLTHLGLHVLGEVAFGLEGELAVQALVGPVVCVGAQVLLQHAWLLAADPAHLAHVLASAPTPHVLVVFLAFVACAELEWHAFVVEDLHHLVLGEASR